MENDFFLVLHFPFENFNCIALIRKRLWRDSESSQLQLRWETVSWTSQTSGSCCSIQFLISAPSQAETPVTCEADGHKIS